MKVHLYGNILNNAYNLAIFLRRKGVEAEVFLDNSSSLSQDFPWWEDPTLDKDNLPPWIHYYAVKPNFLFPQKELKCLIQEFAKCDVALVCGWGPIIAKRAKVPFFFYSYGGDLIITAFWESFRGIAREVLELKKPAGIKSLFLYSRMQRRAIQSANRIGIGMGYQVNNYVVPLGIYNKMVKFRLAWDIEKYRVPEDRMLANKYRNFDFVCFCPARQSWTSVWKDTKGNDKWFKAFARFVRERKPNVRVVCIEKGTDLARSKQLVLDLGISDYVEWIPEMNKDGIRAYNSISNVVVVDQFWHDKWYLKYPGDKAKPRMGFGSASIEALSAERILITSFFDEDFYGGISPPIFHAFSEDQIYARLIEIQGLGSEERTKIGRLGYEFAKKYHGWESTTDLYIDVLNQIVASRK